MLWILYAVLAPILILAVALLLKEAASYLNLRHYATQGIEIYYIPFFGLQQYLRIKNNEKDPLSRSKEVFKEISKNKRGMVAFNSLISLQPFILLSSKETISEFYKLEVENFKRNKMFDNGAKTRNSFFYKGGVRGYHIRSYYADFFNYQNILKMMKSINRVINLNFTEYRKKLESEGKLDWIQVDISILIQKIFDDLIYELLFGDSEEVRVPSIEGLPLSVYIERFMLKGAGIIKDPFYWLTFGIPHKLGVFKSSRTVFSMRKKIGQVLLDVYKQRKSRGPSGSINIFDLMIEAHQKINNQGDIDELLSENDIIEDLLTFYFEATDTSRSVIGSLLYTLSTMPELTEEVWKGIRSDILKEDIGLISNVEDIDYDGSTTLNMLVKEGLRRFGPTDKLVPRVALANVKLGGVKIKKGTFVTILYNGVHHDEAFFTDPLKFNIYRWTQENSKKVPNWMYAPFGLGKRNCVGQQLGENIIKSMILNFLAVFELQEANNYEPKWSCLFSLVMNETIIRIRPRRL